MKSKNNVRASIAAVAAIGVNATRAAAPFLFALPILLLVWTVQAFAQGAANVPVPAAPTASPSAELLKNWRHGMVRATPPQAGCFTSSYPNVQWQEVPCVPGPAVPFLPAKGPPLDTVGSGNDPVTGIATGRISTAVGSFDSATNVTSVTSPAGKPDTYSLQLNANFVNSPVCSGAKDPSKCFGWQQFIFSNNSDNPALQMQYWLFEYNGTTCPPGAGWTYSALGGGCFTNSLLLHPPQQTIANLGNLSLTAQVNSGGMDAVILSTGSTLYMVQNNDDVLGLAGNWTAFEYNIVGDGGGSQVTFNPGASIVVRASVDNGSPSSFPSCVGPNSGFGGYTGESNNLYLQPASGTPRSSTQQALVFTESSNTATTKPCNATVAVPAASKLTDTHDFNGDGFSDIVWSGPGGTVAVWLMNGGQAIQSGTAGTAPGPWSIVGQRDFNGDGTYDLLWLDSSGDLSIWFMIGTQVFSSAGVGNVGTTWSVVGTADFNSDGMGDILWRDTRAGIPRSGS